MYHHQERYLLIILDTIINSLILSTKILLVPPKCEIIIMLSNINIGLFSIAPCKVIALIIFSLVFNIISFYTYPSLSISLLMAIAISFTLFSTIAIV